MACLAGRRTSLERTLGRLCWTICAVIALPVLVAALIEHRMGYTGSTNELTWIVLYPIALGTTVSLLVARSFAEISPRSRRASRAGAVRDRALRHGCPGDQPGNRLALIGRRCRELEERRPLGRLLAR